MQTRVRDLIAQGDALFSRRQNLLGLWQEVAENFCPWRADFTRTFTMGDEYASHLMTGVPILAHRELKDQIAAMLRPRGKDWFGMTVEREGIAQDSTVKAWFQDKAAVMKRIMYDRKAGFTWATKEGDEAFTAFGQAVLSVELNAEANGLLYRSWHLRDVAWAEDAHRQIDTVHRKWNLPVRAVLKLWPKTADAKLRKKAQDAPNDLVKLRHIILPADEYDFTSSERRKDAVRFPFVSIYVDEDHDTVLEETPLRRSPYVIPRWQTVSGSQYAHSPATVVGLPDARLLQQITLTLLEAGEKAVNPPLIAQGDQVQGGVNVYAGGVTWVDSDYDERNGEAIRALNGFGKGALAFGADMGDRYVDMIQRAFYLDKIRLPAAGEAMTATEIRTRVEEYIRAALPLFEPMEIEYNGALVEETFNLALENGAFGNLDDMPASLRGQEVQFTFESPLQAAQGRDKTQAFLEAGQLLATAAQVDPQSVVELDIRKAFRDALDGAQVPAAWMVPDDVAQKVRAQAAQAQKMQQTAQEVATGAGVAGQVGDAATKLQEAGLIPQAAVAPQIEGAPV